MKIFRQNRWWKNVYVELNFNGPGPGPSSFMSLPFGLITNANFIGTNMKESILEILTYKKAFIHPWRMTFELDFIIFKMTSMSSQRHKQKSF